MEVGYECLDIAINKFCAELWHLTFNALFDVFCDPGIAFSEVLKARAFVAARVLAVTVSAISLEQIAAFFRFSLDARVQGDRGRVG